MKLIIAFGLTVLICLMYPISELETFSYSLGTVWTKKDLIAPFSFPIYKNQRAYEHETTVAVQSVYPVFDRHRTIEVSQIESLRNTLNLLTHISSLRERWLKTQKVTDSLRYFEHVTRLPFELSEKDWAVYNAEKKRFWNLISIVTDILRAGIVDSSTILQTSTKIAVRRGIFEDIIANDKIYTLDKAINQIHEHFAAEGFNSDFIELSIKLIKSLLRPTVIFNVQETQNAIMVAKESVPRTIGIVQENERIVSKHERISEEIKLKLDSFLRAKIERGADTNNLQIYLGVFLHVGLVIGLYGIYLFLFRKRIYHNNTMLLLIASLLLIETFFAYLSLKIDIAAPLRYLIFVPAASMLLTIIFDSRVAFYGTVTMAFLIAGIHGNDYSVSLAALVAGALGAYTVCDIRNRMQIFRSFGFIFLGYFITILSLGLQRSATIGEVSMELIFALANSIVSPVLTYGLLIFFERFFKVTTDLTLLELSDFNQPLLRRLSEEAPGTFHHSIMIGNIVEAAAEAIGANSILARVGAYYHDIGKCLRPEYFIENQTTKYNRHQRLKPRLSASIIISHVKNGIELGKQFGLPEKIIDFIPQHHGTTLCTFFFDKAIKQSASKNESSDSINDAEFRYPGPKPQSKETALVMLADSVEASVRSMLDFTPQKFESAIEEMIKIRFFEGQLDECNLTLRDLRLIIESFTKTLTGIYHARIQYPQIESLQRSSETGNDISKFKPSTHPVIKDGSSTTSTKRI